ncbi:MAG: TonB-dependent receptor, partial [Candidatus Korobacteraceae bacterium]
PGVELAAGAALPLDIQLPLEQQSESVNVTEEVPTVDTTSSQVGETITTKTMTAVPLNGRSFTDLLAIQPGVIPASSAQPNAVVMSGCAQAPPSGDLNPGNLSVAGQRETSNGFNVNGADVEEDFNNGTAIIPNLDSIQDLKVLTSNFDAEYGNFAGGQVLAVTKSGGNNLHGSAFEFLRNTALDARGYFDPTRPAYERNQYGGTLGGPIRKDKAFFFLDYQGTQMTQGQETGVIAVPTAAEQQGNFGSLLTRSVSGANLAQQLSQELCGQPGCVTVGEPFSQVFPNGMIPQKFWSAPALALMKYIPLPNGPNGFSSAAQNETVGDNKAGARMDLNTGFGALSAYYFIDQYNLNNPYPTAQGGANVPGFNALSNGRAQLISLGATKAFGGSTVNEAHFSYMRDFNIIGKPQGGVGPSLSSQGFTQSPKSCSGQSTLACLGIVPLDPSIEGIENVAFNNFTIGVDVTGETQVNNTYQWSDNLTHIAGHHTFKIGGDFHLDQVNIHSNSINNGGFVFQGTETGSDFADFLLGVASSYEQGDASSFYIRNRYIGLYAQDSWQARPNLVLNYGVRWDVLPPWREKYNQLQTFVLGQQSEVYKGAPAGIVFPGDAGIPSTLAPTKWTNFSPRIGFSYSPNSDSSFLHELFGSSGKSSIHGAFGIFYSAIEGLSAGIMSANPPYGYDYDSTGGLPLFSTPFSTASSAAGTQPFPSPIPAFGASPSHPNSTVNWANYTPITGDPAFYYRNTSPYTESYNLAFERELTPNTVLKLAYVGSRAHHLLVLTSANPGNPALCLSLSQPSEVKPGTPTCGPFNETGVFYPAGGGAETVRGPFNTFVAGSAPYSDIANFGAITYQKTIGFSNYNSFEATLRHTTRSLELMAAYTYGKSLDDSSSLSEPVYPMGAALTKAPSAFDLRSNFVLSYRYQLPFDRLSHRQNRWTTGWSLSGITRFSTGLPVTLYNNTDSSLLGTFPNGINNNTIDTPYFTPGKLEINHNPGSNSTAFNTALFCIPGGTFYGSSTPCPVGLGTMGNVPRRFFYGPGLENFDMALQKEIALHDGKMLQFRLEAFNVFNHAQFFGAAAVDGNISDSTFGKVINAMPPRQVQLAAKFVF